MRMRLRCCCSWAKLRAMGVLLIEAIQMASKLDANGCWLATCSSRRLCMSSTHFLDSFLTTTACAAQE
ncbi:hypothetical protein BC831DRAFT_450834 [Entophlyctis helioformis]|nr:hypothetical protein BC831DRAFT_450834 [Entophlyctis helioformis]